MHVDENLNRHLLHQREEQVQHLEYNLEYQFYHAVASGDLEQVQKYYLPEDDISIYEGAACGQLSKDVLQNARYHFVVAVALITRICVEHGLERETAYTLSDVFIQEMDQAVSISEITALHNQMVTEFAQRMQRQQKQRAYSIHLVKAISYISAHLHEKISTKEIADALSLNRSYLSTLFHREMGISLHAYIRSQKIQAAAQMLLTSDLGLSEISALYGFSSQSQFSQCFRQEIGETPFQYRKHHFQSSAVSE